MEKEFLVSKRNILSEVAKWAVAQSPYHRPDNLEIVLDKLNEFIPEWKDKMGYGKMSYGELKDFLGKHLKSIPEFNLWNERKNGRQGHGFTGAGHHDDGSVKFFNAKADDDFIDLDALIRNVANSIIREGTEVSIPEVLGKGKAEHNSS